MKTFGITRFLSVLIAISVGFMGCGGSGGSECEVADDCPDEEVCIEGTCWLECDADADCGTGLECSGGYCTSKSIVAPPPSGSNNPVGTWASTAGAGFGLCFFADGTAKGGDNPAEIECYEPRCEWTAAGKFTCQQGWWGECNTEIESNCCYGDECCEAGYDDYDDDGPWETTWELVGNQLVIAGVEEQLGVNTFEKVNSILFDGVAAKCGVK